MIITVLFSPGMGEIPQEIALDLDQILKEKTPSVNPYAIAVRTADGRVLEASVPLFVIEEMQFTVMGAVKEMMRLREEDVRENSEAWIAFDLFLSKLIDRQVDWDKRFFQED